MTKLQSLFRGRPVAAVLAWLAAGLPAYGLEPPACREVVSEDIVITAGPDGIALRSGSRVRLVDLRLAPGARADTVLASFAGAAVTVGAVGEADRWGRVAASLRLVGSPPIDLAELLVGEGLAIVDAGPREDLCRRELLAAETVARRRRRGLWAGGAWPIPARDPVRLAAAAGEFAVVEGRVVSVGERRDRTYLNFGRDFARDFSVTLPRRSWASLKARGVTAAGLTGRQVRVRGMIEMRRAPTLDIVSPDMLEVLDGSDARTDSP